MLITVRVMMFMQIFIQGEIRYRDTHIYPAVIIARRLLSSDIYSTDP